MPATLRQRSSLLAALLTVVLTGCFFGGSWWRSETFGYRDAANYYYPLFSWQCASWRNGQPPVWNRLDAAGTPSLAEATSSVFYPGKLVFLLPMPFWLRYNLYVSGHVLLAALTLFGAARAWRISTPAALLGAIAYAFGGTVLFQYCNVVFLVGAAWLPCGLAAVDRMIVGRSPRAALVLGLVLALMTLGGDAQMAYHLLLGAALLLLVHWRRSPRRDASPLVVYRCRPVLLATAAAVGFALSAVQILPSMQWTRHSVRATYEGPRTAYEWVSSFGRGEAPVGGLPEAGTHHRQSYFYSVGPWRYAELVWPNIYGRHFPIHRRWIERLPAESRLWSPSMYLGLLPLLLGLGGLRATTTAPRQRWLKWLVIASTAASLGWYGLGWCVNEVTAALPGLKNASLSPPVGGVYWAMNTFLPGYIYFRYPAKLLVVAACAFCLLAAQRWDVLGKQPRLRLAARAGWLAAATIAVLAGWRLLQDNWLAWVANAPADRVFGPLDATAAAGDVSFALVHTLAVAAALGGLLACPLPSRWRTVALLLLTSGDLLLANRWMVQTVPVELLERPVALIAQLGTGRDRKNLVVDAGRIELPRVWARTSSADRMAEVVAWEHANARGKHHLLAELPLMETTATLVAADKWLVRQLTARRSPRSVAVVPRIEQADRITRLPPLTDGHLAAMRRRTREVLAYELAGRGTALAIVETAAALPPLDFDASLVARVVQDGGTRVRVDVESSGTTFLILRDYFYPGWHAVLRTPGQPASHLEVIRTNRVFRGVFIPPGRHQLELVYRPRSLMLGGLLSGASWLLLCGYWLVIHARRR